MATIVAQGRTGLIEVTNTDRFGLKHGDRVQRAVIHAIKRNGRNGGEVRLVETHNRVEHLNQQLPTIWSQAKGAGTDRIAKRPNRSLRETPGRELFEEGQHGWICQDDRDRRLKIPNEQRRDSSRQER